MVNLWKSIRLSWNILRKFAKKHMKLLGVQIVVYCFLICYNVVIEPMIISSVYTALEMQNIKFLYEISVSGSVLIIAFLYCAILTMFIWI